jgi:hypothetical protein
MKYPGWRLAALILSLFDLAGDEMFTTIARGLDPATGASTGEFTI